MKDKDRKIRGRASKGERRQQAILNQTKDKKGFERPVIIQWVSTWLKVSWVLRSQVATLQWVMFHLVSHLQVISEQAEHAQSI